MKTLKESLKLSSNTLLLEASEYQKRFLPASNKNNTLAKLKAGDDLFIYNDNSKTAVAVKLIDDPYPAKGGYAFPINKKDVKSFDYNTAWDGDKTRLTLFTYDVQAKKGKAASTYSRMEPIKNWNYDIEDKDGKLDLGVVIGISEDDTLEFAKEDRAKLIKRYEDKIKELQDNLDLLK